MQPDPNELLEAIGLEVPLVGLYDTPDVTPFEPLVAPARGSRPCIFTFYRNWLRGETLRLTKESFGCPGAGSCLFGIQMRSREEMIDFLLDEEGLKASRDLMGRYVDQRRVYEPEHANLLIGPLRPEQERYLKSVIFFVNPDQLGVLVTGAHFHSGPEEAPVVVAPFGSGCSQLLPAFSDLGRPAAVIGATDSAMRQYLPPDTLAFTVTVPMYRQLCALDEKSFLHKPFWRNLQRARERVL